MIMCVSCVSLFFNFKILILVGLLWHLISPIKGDSKAQ